MGEDFGEGGPPVPGEGQRIFGTTVIGSLPEIIKEKVLTFEEASRCLNTLGKDETGSRYAYLKITAVNRKLTDVSIILNFKHVLFLDLSGNYLTTEALQLLTTMPFLILLKAERNRVESANLNTMHYLQVLDLNQNQIKNANNINQPLLECLEMNFNDIYTTEFETSNLDNLKQLELRSNLLFEISGAYPAKIEKLYLAGNKISSINSQEFTKLAHLQILHLRDNQLQQLDGFSEELSSLTYLNLRNNKISHFKEFKKLQCLPNLEVLVVTGNPLFGDDQPTGEEGEGFAGEGGKVRDPAVIPLLVLLPKLKRINKTVVTLADRIEAEDMSNDVLETLVEKDSNDGETDRTASTDKENLDE